MTREPPESGADSVHFRTGRPGNLEDVPDVLGAIGLAVGKWRRPKDPPAEKPKPETMTFQEACDRHSKGETVIITTRSGAKQSMNPFRRGKRARMADNGLTSSRQWKRFKRGRL